MTDGPLVEPDTGALQRRVLAAVVASQVLSGAGLAAGVTVGALLAARLLGGAVFAGLPIAVLTAGSALTAFLIGQVTAKRGRRTALSLGFATGGIGAIGVVVGSATNSALLLFAALFVYGAGSATNLQARYAGTDLAQPAKRGMAISIALVSTAVGAIAGPNLVTRTGQVAVAAHLPALTGVFLLAGAAYFLAALILAIALRPDPYLVAGRLRTRSAVDVRPETASNRQGIFIGVLVMLAAQIAMTGIMTMTPVEMRADNLSLDAVGLVIGLHIAAMYLPSLVTGLLVDRLGRPIMAALSGVVLVAAGVLAALSSTSIPLIVLALVLLGLGWNIGLITGTAMIVDATNLSVRARVQGSVDVLVALSGAIGGAGSGLLVAASNYAVLGLVGAAIGFVLIPIQLLRLLRPNSVITAS